ncbi:proteoglycan 4a [Salminus brasiliensis]|uniref:proteoglycan 4a n=1 Tax=Salminus brasiliensis TaxID=930266 RepID=UPI003B837EDA
MTCLLLPLCAAQVSCRGRCGEPFTRGQLCNCDHNCLAHNECCKDYEDACTFRGSCRGRCGETFRRGRECECDPDCTLYNTCCSDFQGQCGTGLAAGQLQPGPLSPGKPLTIPIQVSLSISGHAGGPAAAAGRPSTLEDIAQALGASNPAGPSPDLCNGLPIDALTSLFNGSIIVFKGHFFFLLDPKTRTAGPAQSITEQLGVPSPIDTAFTRCNCQGKTYIIKGDKYWVFENGVMEAGYPRSLSQDFDGLTGEITAALSVPATRKRPESIYFFKKGGTVQKFSYPAGSGPSCTGKKAKNSVYSKIRRARQAEIRLSAEININLNWKGFPTPVTSALSTPNPRKPDGFEYLIFSWPKFFNIKISGEFPTLASSAKPPAQQNDIRNWLNCP